jgi:hypothetical protein
MLTSTTLKLSPCTEHHIQPGILWAAAIPDRIPTPLGADFAVTDGSATLQALFGGAAPPYLKAGTSG